MNWDAIGAIGEIVGAAAVIGTLAYLSVQIRQTNVIAREQAHYHMLQNQISYYDRLATDPEFVKTVYGEHLNESKVRHLQHQSHATSVFFRWNWEFLRAQEGIYGSTDVPVEGFRREFKNADLGEQWTSQQHIFDVRFVRFMNAEVAPHANDA